MDKSDIYYRELAIRYFNGCISLAEEELLFQFVKAASENEKLFRQWEQEWTVSTRLIPEVDNEWRKLQGRMSVRYTSDDRQVSVSGRRHLSWYVAAAVIAVLLLGSGIYGVQQYVYTRMSENIFALKTGMGEKSRLVLADGTTVYLNAGSSLQYSGNFNTKNREVTLFGEAYFEVTQQPGNIPFTVKTDQYNIVVKGTKFNVSSYNEDELSTTALLEGSIDILYKGKHFPVVPGELVRLNKQNGELSREKGQTAQYTSWIEGRVEYDKITLSELAVRLSRKYDVSITLDDSLNKDVAFRVSLRNEETIGDILQALSRIIPIRYERSGRDIYIRKQ
ncbi:FecR domain-containing protein [Parabacteroides sp.]|uniref:FecR family protein n=1 Tax=Parabacteroides sp. TaxID=1869337 RepID=UPI00259B8920|nr:FecR domain-containing protein [uncultured Parabacteroides sp.]